MSRKVIQIICGSQTGLYAFCDDGTIWCQLLGFYPAKWSQVKGVPQEDKED